MQMQTQEELISKLTVIGATIAAVLTFLLSSGVYTLWTTVAGAVLLLMLFTYSLHGGTTQTRIEHVLSSAVFSLSTLLFLGWFVVPLFQLFNLSTLVLVVSIGNSNFHITWTVLVLVWWLVVAFAWMRISPKQSWPRLFQTGTQH